MRVAAAVHSRSMSTARPAPSRLVVVLDALLAAASMGLAAMEHGLLRQRLGLLEAAVQTPVLVSVTVAVVLVWGVGSAAAGLGSSLSLAMPRGDVLRGLLKLHVGGLLALTLYLFLLQQPFNRSLVLLFLGNSLVLLGGYRAAVRRYARLQRQLGQGRRRVLVVGSAEAAAAFPWASGPDDLHPERLGRLGPEDGGTGWLGGEEKLATVLHDQVVDLVLFVAPWAHPDEATALLDACEEVGVPAAFPIVVPPAATSRPQVGHLADQPVVLFDVAPKQADALAVKHAIDVVAAAAGLLLIAPLLLLVALAILVTMGRPVLFIQQRAGLYGRPFPLMKFRTMVPGAERARDDLAAEHNEAGGPVFKMTADPRITPLGHLLRRTSIDELPQLVNVLLGQMSLVGPRPLPLTEQQEIRGWHRRRLSMKPGITGLWQVSGRSDIPFEQWMALDVRYIDEWSLWLDVELLVRTVPAVLGSKGAR